MAKDTRQRIVGAAARLLAAHGVDGVSLADVLAAAEAPRGSLYHHFPGGKDQLVGEAITLVGSRSLEHMAGLDGRTPEDVTRHFLAGWRHLLAATDFRVGCAVMAATVAGQSGDVLSRADAVFVEWNTRLAELFVAGGAEVETAAQFATTLIASTEGAVAMSRARASLEPFEVVAEAMVAQAKRLT